MRITKLNPRKKKIISSESDSPVPPKTKHSSNSSTDLESPKQKISKTKKQTSSYRSPDRKPERSKKPQKKIYISSSSSTEEKDVVGTSAHEESDDKENQTRHPRSKKPLNKYYSSDSDEQVENSEPHVVPPKVYPLRSQAQKKSNQTTSINRKTSSNVPLLTKGTFVQIDYYARGNKYVT